MSFLHLVLHPMLDKRGSETLKRKIMSDNRAFFDGLKGSDIDY